MEGLFSLPARSHDWTHSGLVRIESRNSLLLIHREDTRQGQPFSLWSWMCHPAGDLLSSSRVQHAATMAIHDRTLEPHIASG